MPLTPLDIHNKEFSKSFRGYNEDEVNEFLDQIIKDMEIIIRDKQNLETKVTELEYKLDKFNHIEDSLNRSIVIAQETSEDIKRNAQMEAKLIVKEAEKNADRIISEAIQKSSKMTLELDDLKKQALVFKQRLKLLVEAQLDMLSNDDWENILGMEPQVSYINHEE
ncbi:MAG: septum formation initiator [Bacillales bacterium]|jgi:cell division initiation protein|nr:septum formation initiator [Bacillales bacterium]